MKYVLGLHFVHDEQLLTYWRQILKRFHDVSICARDPGHVMMLLLGPSINQDQGYQLAPIYLQLLPEAFSVATAASRDQGL